MNNVKAEDIWVMDTESDALWEDATKIWIAVSQNLGTGEMLVFEDPGSNFVTHLKQAGLVVMHNLLEHDRPLIHKLLGYRIPLQKCCDTLLVSQFLHPDRDRPDNYIGKGGPNSIEAWGFRLGRHKPEHEDWSQYSEAMRVRCQEDVEINVLLFHELLKEFAALYMNEQ